MRLVRAGGHSGGKDRQDRNGTAGGVLLAGGVRECGRQGIAARLGQGQGAAILGETLRYRNVISVLGQRPGHRAVQAISGQQLHVLGPVRVAILRQGERDLPNGQDLHGFLTGGGAAAVLHGALQRVPSGLHKVEQPAIPGEILRHRGGFAVMG